jgi:hypothetical protein
MSGIDLIRWFDLICWFDFSWFDLIKCVLHSLLCFYLQNNLQILQYKMVPGLSKRPLHVEYAKLQAPDPMQEMNRAELREQHLSGMIGPQPKDSEDHKAGSPNLTKFRMGH